MALRIGAFEFAGCPGQVDMRNAPPMLWPYLLFSGAQLYLAGRDVLSHNVALGVGSLVIAVLFINLYFSLRRQATNAKPLLELRDGRLIIRSVDAGPAGRIVVSVAPEGKQFLILAHWPELRRKPYLIWRAAKWQDGEGLRQLVASVISAAGEGVRPPAPIAVEE